MKDIKIQEDVMKVKNIRLFAIVLTTLFFQHFPANSQNRSDTIRIHLDKAIEMAISENPTMRIAGRDIEVKKNYKKEQIVALFPSISASASYNYNIQKQKMVMEGGGLGDLMGILGEIAGRLGIPWEGGGNSGGGNEPMEIGTSNNWSAGINFSLPIVAPATWFNVKLSQLDVEMALENARSSKISLMNEVKKAYYNYLLAKDSYHVLLRNYDNLQLTFENILQKFNQGLASELEKIRAEVQFKNQIPGLKSAERNIELAVMMLKIMIGVDVNEAIIFEGTLADFEKKMKETPLPNINSLNLSDNPDLNKLDITIQQLNTGIKILKSSSSPVLALSGVWQTSAMSNNFEFKNYNWFPYSYIAIGLNVPIVSWAGTAFKIKSSKLNIQNLEDQKKYLEDNLKVSVLNSINQIHNTVEDLESNKNTVLLAEKVYEISKKQYDIGFATWLDLNAAELALTSSQLAYNQSIYNYLSAYANLEKTLGK
jgi:outer membrane protein TolC